MLTEAGDLLAPLSLVGYPDELVRATEATPLDLPGPTTEALRTAEVVFYVATSVTPGTAERFPERADRDLADFTRLDDVRRLGLRAALAFLQAHPAALDDVLHHHTIDRNDLYSVANFLARTKSRLLAVSLVGMAQVSARFWLTEAGGIERGDAAALVAGLAWRGIRGYPLTDEH